MATSAIRMNFSQSVDGKPFRLTAGVSPGNLLHTATASATPGAGGTWDEIYLWTSSVGFSFQVTVEFGDMTAPDHVIMNVQRGKAGMQMLLNGLILQNGQLVRAYSTLFCNVTGFVNRVTN